MRSVCNVFHAFAINSFFDEIAHARGVDPRQSLLDVLGPPRIVSTHDLGVAKLPNYGAKLEDHPIDVGRLRRVIERATENARWSDREKDGRALGLAAHRSFLTYVAVVASVRVKEVEGKKRVHVDEVWLVADAGTVVNLDRVRAQLEGAVVFGTSIALFGDVPFKAGAAVPSNFRDFRIARIADAPRAIHVDVIESEGRPGGIGEPGVPPIAPAVANAVFAATGTRIRELPLARHDLA